MIPIKLTMNILLFDEEFCTLSFEIVCNVSIMLQI